MSWCGCVVTDLLAEFWGLYLYEAGLDCLHEAPLVAKGHPAGADGVLVSVSVDSGIDHTPKQVVHYVGQDIWSGVCVCLCVRDTRAELVKNCVCLVFLVKICFQFVCV